MKSRTLKANKVDEYEKNDELFIKLVKEREVLWNSEGDSLNKKGERDLAWKSISKQIKQPVLKCINRWRGLRGRFTTADQNSDLNWKLYKELTFLKKEKCIRNVNEEDNDALKEDGLELITEQSSNTDEYSIKYGEIFLSDSAFFYRCYFCYDQFLNGDDFQEHCILTHPIENLDADVQDVKTELSADEQEKIKICDKPDNKNNFDDNLVIENTLDTLTETFTAATFNDCLKYCIEIKPMVLFKCNVCDYQTENKENYIIHAEDHPCELVFKCEICQKAFKKYGYLVDHRNIHKLRNGPDCTVCEKSFEFLSQLRTHMFGHIKLESKKKRINSDSSNYSQIEENKDLVPGKNSKEDSNQYEESNIKKTCELKSISKIRKINRLLLYCSECNFKTQNKILLNAHVKVKHFDKVFKPDKPNEPHFCQYCGRIYKTKSSLERHEKNHTETKPVFTCQFCGKEFNYISSRRDHENLHTGNRPYKCKFCPKTFCSRGTFNIHERVKHLKNHTFACKVCGKPCLKRRQALEHEASHAGQKLYGCDICEKSYTTNSGLLLHKRTHANLRNYICKICNKGFNSKHCLTRHMSVHNEENKYACGICPRKFNFRENLYKHSKVHFENASV